MPTDLWTELLKWTSHKLPVSLAVSSSHPCLPFFSESLRQKLKLSTTDSSTAENYFSSVKDGSFRVYSGGRNKADLIDYVEKEKWQADEVLPGWKVPNTYIVGM